MLYLLPLIQHIFSFCGCGKKLSKENLLLSLWPLILISLSEQYIFQDWLTQGTLGDGIYIDIGYIIITVMIFMAVLREGPWFFYGS